MLILPEQQAQAIETAIETAMIEIGTTQGTKAATITIMTGTAIIADTIRTAVAAGAEVGIVVDITTIPTTIATISN